MTQHSGLYNTFPLEKKRHYDAVADEANVAAALAADAALYWQEAQLLLAKSRNEQESKARGQRPNLSDHRFTDADMETLLYMYTSATYSPARIQAATTRAHMAPEQPPQHVRDAFAAVQIGETAPRATIQATWLKRLCEHRHHCMGVAFGTSLAEGSQWFVFLFASQSPLEVWFARAELCSMTIPAYDSFSHAERVEYGDVWQPYQFQMGDVSFVRDLNLDFAPDADVQVLVGLKFVGASLCRSRGPCLSLKEWEEEWPLPETASGSKNRSHKPHASDDVLEKFPWVADCLKGQKPARTSAAASSSAGAAASSSAGEACALSEEEDDLVEAAYQVVCEELNNVDGVMKRGQDFITRLRGTQGWSPLDTEPTTGLVACEAKQGVPRAWCRQYGLQLSVSYSIVSYGYSTSMTLAEEWCNRMKHYFNIWVENGGGAFQYSAEDLASYTPEGYWVSRVANMPKGSPAAGRAALIDTIQPINTR